MKSVKYDGHEVEYSHEAVHSWSVQRRIARGGSDAFDAIDAILGGRADEVAEELGGSMEAMSALMDAIAEAEGADAKN